MHTKKSQSLSMNTIIIAALALLVLAIVSLLFIGRMNTSGRAIAACENNGGVCINTLDGNFAGSCDAQAQRDGFSAGRTLQDNCPGPNDVCCLFVP